MELIVHRNVTTNVTAATEQQGHVITDVNQAGLGCHAKQRAVLDIMERTVKVGVVIVLMIPRVTT